MWGKLGDASTPLHHAMEEWICDLYYPPLGNVLDLQRLLRLFQEINSRQREICSDCSEADTDIA